MKYILSILIIALLCAGSESWAQTYVGYTNGTVNRKAGVRFGTDGTQGMAIYIPAEKAAALKGATLTGLRAAFSTGQITNMQIFLTRELGGQPIATASVTGAATIFKQFYFDQPVTLDGEAFYLGYTLTVSTSYSPHLFDAAADFSDGIAWALSDGNWIDVSRRGYGAPNLQLMLEDAPAFTDLIMKPIAVNGFFKVGSTAEFSGQVFNFGTAPVEGIEVLCKTGGALTRYALPEVTIAPGAVYDFNMPAQELSDQGDLSITLTAETTESTDVHPDDNYADTHIYIYPLDVQRNVLVEQFTTQQCSNCPMGHKVVEAALEKGPDNYITVAHHSGYYTDIYTMAEDNDYLWFYNSGSTFAPGVMFNRRPATDGAASVVLGANDNGEVTAGIQAASVVAPYMGITLANSYDALSGKGIVTAYVTTYQSPSDEVHRLNLCLTQDNLVGTHAGAGDGYVHNHVFRGAINGTWGEDIDLIPGQTVVRSYEYEIKDYITSSVNKVSIPTDTTRMHIVAFVSDATSSPLTCYVWNAAQIGLTEAGGIPEGIDAVSSAALPTLQVVGSQLHFAHCRRAEVWNVAGSLLHVLDHPDRLCLSRGCYIVRLTSPDGHTLTRKVSL